jgi:transposase
MWATNPQKETSPSMRPIPWYPARDLSEVEQTIIRQIRRAKLFVWLRLHRHELFDEELQAELAGAYSENPVGQPGVPPAQLALATILQAYMGCSDDEAIECTLMDRRWQLVLDCLEAPYSPFSKGTLVAFRRRLIEHGLDRRLVERTIELAEKTKGFSPRQLRGALDSSPLWGAGRVEDTINLLGHALRKAVGMIARQQGRGLAELAEQAGVGLLAGSSLKEALDEDWEQAGTRDHALGVVLGVLEQVESLVAAQPEAAPTALVSLVAAQQVRDQDVVIGSKGEATLRKGVAKDRRISIEDPQMRHGRKTRSLRVDGYKRHVLTDLDSELVRAVGVTLANAPEATVSDQIKADLAGQRVELGELHIDRAYLSSSLVQERSPELEVYCKSYPVRNGPRFSKAEFQLDWEQQQIRCPNDVVLPLTPGAKVQFPTEVCAICPIRQRCTGSKRGRSVQIHPDERLMEELRDRQRTPEGRAQLRKRVQVEHTLAHIGHWQGRRARYLGQRKNLLDLRRSAIVHNLHVIARQPQKQAA